MPWPFVSRRERLRREAADWVARLNGADAENERIAFERWYRSDPDRAAAYDRMAAIFEAAGKARRVHPASAGSGFRGGGRSGPIRYALAAAVAGAALLAVLLLSARTVPPGAEGREQIAAFSAGEGESRRLVLADRSEILLSPGSALDVAMTGKERRLRLVRGEGRFTVAPEARPFIVAADATEVVARGTQFVVRIASDATTVSLIEGRVEVTRPPSPEAGGQKRVTRLRPGQQLVVQRPPRARKGLGAAAGPPTARPRPPAMLQFDDTPLDRAVEQASREDGPRLRLGDPALARLRVTGAFRAGDTASFARAVADAFDLELRRGSDGSLWLRPRPSD